MQISHEEVVESYGSESNIQLKSLGKRFWSFSSTVEKLSLERNSNPAGFIRQSPDCFIPVRDIGVTSTLERRQNTGEKDDGDLSSSSSVSGF